MFTRKLLIAALFVSIVAPAFAAADKYEIDPMHTYPSLEFSHMGISVWRGKFNKTSGTIMLDRQTKTGTVDINIDPNSIDFGLDSMYEHAAGEKWFDVAKYPKANYKGTIKFTGDTPKTVDGQLTFRGVTRPVTLAINSFKCITHPVYKKEVCGADAEGELNWANFGIQKYGEGDTDKVRLRIQVEGLKQN